MVDDQRARAISRIESHVGRRRLLWFGTRGTDASPLLDLPALDSVYGVVAPLGATTLEGGEWSLESATLHRVDLDVYSFDADVSPAAMELRRRLLEATRYPSVLLPYRPLAFLSNVAFGRFHGVKLAGLFHERHAPFEHKPWVESELRARVQVVPWHYYHASDLTEAGSLLSRGPVVVRPARSSGGVGMGVVHNPSELPVVAPDAFVSIAPFLAPNIPLNVGACVFEDGQTSLHPPSLQLVGVKGATTRPFGYCGNDFAAASNLADHILDDLDAMTRAVGSWLAGAGYRGAFGIDALVHHDKVFLTEVNPRFQGSSEISSRLDAELGRPDIYQDHLLAFFEKSPIDAEVGLRELAARAPPMAHLLVHQPDRRPRAPPPLPAGVFEELRPDDAVELAPGAVERRVVARAPMTTDGFSVGQRLQAWLEAHSVRAGDGADDA